MVRAECSDLPPGRCPSTKTRQRLASQQQLRLTQNSGIYEWAALHMYLSPCPSHARRSQASPRHPRRLLYRHTNLALPVRIPSQVLSQRNTLLRQARRGRPGSIIHAVERTNPARRSLTNGGPCPECRATVVVGKTTSLPRFREAASPGMRSLCAREELHQRAQPPRCSGWGGS